MNLLRFFSRPPSATAARERLQVLLAHERITTTGDSDLVGKLRDEILRVIAKHIQIDDEKVSIKMERGAQVSTLEVDIEIPFDAGKGNGKAVSELRQPPPRRAAVKKKVEERQTA